MSCPHAGLNQLYYYSYFGLSIASEVEIPEWSPFETTDGAAAPDVLIGLGRADEAWALSDDCLPIIKPACCEFYIPETGHYRVNHGREIVATPAPAAGMREVRLFLLGSAWSALCYQRGLLVLHASVVQVGESCIAFCGATGSGKSTVAAWLAVLGHCLLGDDLCRFDVPPHGQPCVYPSAPRFKLWQDTLEALGWSNAGLERDHSASISFIGLSSAMRSCNPCP